MAKKKNNFKKSTLDQTVNTFDKGLVSDVSGYALSKSAWTYARNAINNSSKGDLSKLITEPANKHCIYTPYVIIGAIHLSRDLWCLFSTDDVNSEIGLFKSETCEYDKVVNNKCLNFRTSNLIKGVARSSFDCSHIVYWDDNKRNPSRFLKLNDIPWVQNCTDSNGESPGGCITCVDTDVLDCDKLRLESFIKQPCVTLKKGPSAGSILNGSYYVQLAYMVNGQRVTDYFSMSNILSVFNHENVNGSIEIEVEDLDANFDEYEVAIISTISDKQIPLRLGIYSTNQNRISVDYIANTLLPVLEVDLFLRTPVPDRSEAIMTAGDYLLRSNPTSKFDFNYQPLANQISCFWQSVEYPKNYYQEGGVNVGHMRDEVYPYFIRWIYKTGDKSKSYHIPGRAAQNFILPSDSASAGSSILENATAPGSVNIIESEYSPKVFEVYNTASITSYPNTQLSDGGVVIAEGKMGYHESSEFYPDKTPDVWNASSHAWSDAQDPAFDLCGERIRHHKFPENAITSGATSTAEFTNHYKDGGEKIRVMGVRFSNVSPPVDNNGVLIPNVAGYEILRGSRNGNKTVLYKGMINNMWEYDLPKMNNTNSKKGLYANYPFNDLNADPFISVAKDGAGNPIPTNVTMPLFGGEGRSGTVNNHLANTNYKKNYFTFHSPDTQFVKPFLSNDELKIYGVTYGLSVGQYNLAQNHPKHKLLKDLAFVASVAAGLGYAITKMVGTKTTNYEPTTYKRHAILAGAGTASGGGILSGPTAAGVLLIARNLAIGIAGVAAEILDAVTGTNVVGILHKSLEAADLAASAFSEAISSGKTTITYTAKSAVPRMFRMALAAMGNPLFSSYTAEGGDTLLKTITSLGGYNQFALDCKSTCFYEDFSIPEQSNRRKNITKISYLKRGIAEFDPSFKVNHIYRNNTVMLNTATDVNNVTAALIDGSRLPRVSQLDKSQINEIGEAGDLYFKPVGNRASSHYVAVKNRLRNQYGQVHNIRQLPTQMCMVDVSNPNTPVIFGGDTYIGKYSEKNVLYYFNKWLNGEKDGAQFNYFKHQMFEHTSFWMDAEAYDMNEFFGSVPDAFSTAAEGNLSNGFRNFIQALKTPSDKYALDSVAWKKNGLFLTKFAYMYLFNSSVREFYVETELNIDYRDHGSIEAQQHYPVLSDLKTMFHPNIIESDNYYKLDRSLSASFLAYSKVSWGELQDRQYNPLVASSCYTNLPRRLLYSLPQDIEGKKDNWSVFLPYNYKDFSSRVVNIKDVDQTGALILFENSSPGKMPTTDQLETKNGTKLTIGDAGLFARGVQQLVNSEKAYEYGSCQSFYSMVSTPVGIFWINLNQGKIFSFSGQLKEITMKDNKFWFNQFLPYNLTKDFPTFEAIDNPVSGIGCQVIYDNEYSLVYFCKKDYKIKPGLPYNTTIVYLGGTKFLINGFYQTTCEDPLYFENCSWTVSYDPKQDEFVSFHDWHPDLSMPGINSFFTTKKSSVWKHNSRKDKFCNYYGKDYPFEVEFEMDNEFEVNTLKTISYNLENYVYNDYDRFQILDRNFDEAVVYNAEQSSGLLRLELSPKNDIAKLVSYPEVHLNYIKILYSKEEQLYRFNQFSDIIKDRGEFTGVKNFIWKTESNGYIKVLNEQAHNYKKNLFQLKKFRHHTNKVLLKRRVNNEVEMQVSIAKSLQQNSPR